MTRKEEIEQAAENYYNEVKYLSDLSAFPIAAFKSGAEWADRTMLNKVCEWLKEHIGTYNDTINSIHGTIKIFNKEKFIEDLRKATEE